MVVTAPSSDTLRYLDWACWRVTPPMMALMRAQVVSLPSTTGMIFAGILFPELCFNTGFDFCCDGSVESVRVGIGQRAIKARQGNDIASVIKHHVQHDVAIFVYHVNVEDAVPIAATDIEL